MPTQVMTSIDPRIFREWQEHFAALKLTRSELLRYTIALSCGYSHEDALILAKVKPGSSEMINSLIISRKVA